MITARPLLMAGPMVCALLEGRKTQTRRIAKRPTDHFHASYVDAIKGYDGIWYWTDEKQTVQRPIPLRYKTGDFLWVRERAHYGPDRVAYSADNPALAHGEKVDGWGPARPSIYMPRWASRLTLELTDVRVERLQDISEEDAIAEGISKLANGQWHWLGSSAAPGQHGYHTPTGAYDVLWGDINGLASWPSNPWVWVLSFKVHHANVDTVLAQRAEVAA